MSEEDKILCSTEPSVGKYIGQCKWFNDALGYGFVTLHSGDDKGTDVFVHHSGIKPLNSNYKTLKKGEYISFNVIDGENGAQAVDITGVGGGSLMCDVNPFVRNSSRADGDMSQATGLGGGRGRGRGFGGRGRGRGFGGRGGESGFNGDRVQHGGDSACSLE
jgi:cold shock protein